MSQAKYKAMSEGNWKWLVVDTDFRIRTYPDLHQEHIVLATYDGQKVAQICADALNAHAAELEPKPYQLYVLPTEGK